MLVWSCEHGLQPAPGFQGTVTFPSDDTGKVLWPDSLAGAVVAFADVSNLNLLRLTFPQVIRNILGYTNPLDTSRTQQPYFLQAFPGRYYVAGVIATTVPISTILGQPLDSLAAHPEYFHILGLYGNPEAIIPFRFVAVDDEEITSGIDIHCDFQFTIDF